MAKSRFPKNDELSALFTKLWKLDENRCNPGVDYELDLQGYQTTTSLTGRDWAAKPLFKFVNEDAVFDRPTYHAFRALLDNYETTVDHPEEVLPEEEVENRHFIDLVYDTPVMKAAQEYLVSYNCAPSNPDKFKDLLNDLWFKIYKRTREDDVMNSSGFEHVFVGETRVHDVTGFHNWIQFYLQEKAGNIDYRGYFRRGTTEEMEASPRLITLQFTWCKSAGKPIGSSFVGTSPEFEMALYTIMRLIRVEKTFVRIADYDVELICYPHGRGIGTAYPISKSD